MIKYILYIIALSILILTYKSGIISFPVQEISIITSDKKYNLNKLNKYLDSLYGKDLLLINIDSIKKDIISDDWISDAEVIKSFPSKITIRIIQHEPMALYNNQIISKAGVLINSSTITSKDLPIIIDKDKELIPAYDIYSLSLFNLNKIDLVIKKIEIHHSLVKIYTTSTVLISDRTNFEKNILRLVSLFEDLNNTYGKNITSIDMRYSNGFAIK
jgi:cell division septal protein FtsQ